MEENLFYKAIGMFSVFTIVAVIFFMMVFGILGVILIKKKRVVLPKLQLVIVENLYFPLVGLARMFGLSEKLVDRVGVEARNFIQHDNFQKVDPKDRILLLPHCLRHIKCPGKLNPKAGVACMECGLCIIKDLKIKAEELGYSVVIAPGSGFVKRKIKEVKPKAALCVACYRDLNSVMQSISRYNIPVQGVPLCKDGCVETNVDADDIFEKIHMNNDGNLILSLGEQSKNPT